MQKPITVMREEFIGGVVALVNESTLPAFVKLDVLTNCVRELQALAKAEYQRDLDALKSAGQTEE